jgi:hypothetical protein
MAACPDGKRGQVGLSSWCPFQVSPIVQRLSWQEAALAWTDEAGTLMKRALVEGMAP